MPVGEQPLAQASPVLRGRAAEFAVRPGNLMQAEDMADAEPDPESNNEMTIVFRSVEGFEPPAVELAEAGGPAE